MHVEETLSTLSYATRAKNIQNRPSVQYDPEEAQAATYRREIGLLRQVCSFRVCVCAKACVFVGYTAQRKHRQRHTVVKSGLSNDRYVVYIEYLHASSHAHTHTHTHATMHTYITHTQTHTHTRVQAHKRTCIHILTHTRKRMAACVSSYCLADTLLHAHTHTNTQTHKHTHKHTLTFTG